MKANAVKAGIAAFIITLCLSAMGCGKNAAYSGVSIENADEVSEMIRSAMLHRTYSVKISFGTHVGDKDGMKETIDELFDNALYESEDPRGGDYIRYQTGGYTLTHGIEEGTFKNKYTARIVPAYYTTLEQEDRVDALVGVIIDELDLMGNQGEYDRARLVRDYICDTVAYDTVHKHMVGSKHIQSTAYAALVYHSALCQGYSVLCYRLLKEAGLDARIVTGTAEVDGLEERHAWNIVRIDGEYYNMDVTLDDVTGTDNYFLKSDETFLIDHDRDDKYKSDIFYTSYPMAGEDYAR